MAKELSPQTTAIAREVGGSIGTAQFLLDQMFIGLLSNPDSLLYRFSPLAATTKQFAAQNQAGAGEHGVQVVLNDGFDIAAAFLLGKLVLEVDEVGFNPKNNRRYLIKRKVCIVPKEVDEFGRAQPWSNRQEPRAMLDQINEKAEAARRAGVVAKSEGVESRKNE